MLDYDAYDAAGRQGLGLRHPKSVTARDDLAGLEAALEGCGRVPTGSAHPSPVMPAKAGIQSLKATLDSRLRGNDKDPHPASFAGHPRVFARGQALLPEGE